MNDNFPMDFKITLHSADELNRLIDYLAQSEFELCLSPMSNFNESSNERDTSKRKTLQRLTPHSSDLAERARVFLNTKDITDFRAKSSPLDQILKDREDFLKRFIEIRNESKSD
ncbi:hypothetical protein PGH26_02000 [Sporosarcina jeotgali]|uniref:Uncharacterized protein n=1 Tax=Sporosarcina jeotgali TaxID=3020056 RepID=A0ABZ0KX27_9BACL|nr:hypothetical protein [Sporosarcina sp. B2O-1]WOV84721.1 hypothetical protein PGH26_02000 [Sporosarcina sp. B2O-1]